MSNTTYNGEHDAPRTALGALYSAFQDPRAGLAPRAAARQGRAEGTAGPCGTAPSSVQGRGGRGPLSLCPGAAPRGRTGRGGPPRSGGRRKFPLLARKWRRVHLPPSRQRRRSRARLAAARGAAGRDHGGRRGPHRHLRRRGRGVQPGTGWRGPAPPPLAFLFPSSPAFAAAPPAGPSARGRAAPRRHCSAASPQGFPAAPQGALRGGTGRREAAPQARPAGARGWAGRGAAALRGGSEGGKRAAGEHLPSRSPLPARESGPFPAAAGSAAIVRGAGGPAAARGGGRSAASCRWGDRSPPALPALLGRFVSGGGLICVRKWRWNAQNFLDCWVTDWLTDFSGSFFTRLSPRAAFLPSHQKAMFLPSLWTICPVCGCRASRGGAASERSCRESPALAGCLEKTAGFGPTDNL